MFPKFIQVGLYSMGGVLTGFYGMNSALTQSFRSYQQNNGRYNNSSHCGYSYSSQQKMTKNFQCFRRSSAQGRKGQKLSKNRFCKNWKAQVNQNWKNLLLEIWKKNYLHWKSIANDVIILDIIKNDLKIDFKERPRNICVPEIQHSTKEIEIINSESQKLLDKANKGVTVQCDREPNDFVSTVFTRENKDGSSRTILNLNT